MTMTLAIRHGMEPVDTMRRALLNGCMRCIKACETAEERDLFEKLLPMMAKIVNESYVGFAWLDRIVRSNSVVVHSCDHDDLIVADIVVSSPSTAEEPFRVLPHRLIHTNMCAAYGRFVLPRSMIDDNGMPRVDSVASFIKMLQPFAQMLRLDLKVMRDYMLVLGLSYEEISIEADVPPRDAMEDLDDNAVRATIIRCSKPDAKKAANAGSSSPSLEGGTCAV